MSTARFNTWESYDGTKSVSIEQVAEIVSGTGGGLPSSSVSYTALGGVERSAQAKLGDIVSVMDYGAVGDGVTDDSAAIQAAHDALPAGGCIYFPGTHFWRVETPIQLSKGVTVMGSGFSQTTLVKTSNPDCAFFNVKEEGTTLRDFRMIGMGSSAVTANTYAVTVNTTARRFMAINVHMLNVACGFKLLGNLFTIRDCEIRDIKAGSGVGIYLDQSGVLDGVGLITGTIMQNGNQPYAGIHFVHAVGLLISDCQIMGMNLAMSMTPPSGKYIASIKVVNVYFDGPTNGGLWIQTSGTGYVSRVTVGDSWLSSSTAGAGVRVVANSLVYGLRISDCEIYDNVNGILIDGGGTMQALAIADCVFSGQDTADVSIGANVSGFTVTGCRFGAAGAFSASPTGLYINSGCSDFVVTGNWLHNFTDVGSTTGVVIDANRGLMFGAASYDPPSLASGAGVTTTVACPGAKPGDIADVSYSGDLQGIVLTADVGAANQVVVRFQNGVGATIDLPAGILRVSASRYT